MLWMANVPSHMGSWYVYILRCADDTLYAGVTNDLEARVKAHDAGKGAKYTRSRCSVRLVWCLPCESRGQAQSLEHAVKRLTRRQKLALIAAKGSLRKGVAARLVHHQVDRAGL